MLNYELAKKLKDAGFPQEPKIELGGGCDRQYEKYSFYFCGKQKTCGYDVLCSASDIRKNQDNGTICVKLPTLSELIEAVHEFFDKGSGYREIVLKRYWTAEKNKWEASTETGKGCQEGDSFISVIKRMGESPEDAVAILYISLYNQRNAKT